MSVRPKLPTAKREWILRMVQRRRTLTKLIAELLEEKRKIPDNKTLAKQLGVCYSVVRRTLHGDPYKTRHPEDDQARAA